MDDEERRRQLALTDEQLARFTLRATTGYGTDDDRAYWLDLLESLRRRRARLLDELGLTDEPAAGQAPGDGAATSR